MASKEQRIVAGNINATESAMELFIGRLDKFLNQNLKRLLRELETGNQKALNTAKILGGIKQGLLDAGLLDEVAEIDKIYGALLKAAASKFSEFKEPSAIYSDADYKVTEALINFDESLIANKVYQVTDSLSSTLMRQVITGSEFDTEQLIRDFSTTTLRQINAEINTATSGFYRSITQAKARELNVDLFAYVGANDGIIRPFCEARINKIYTRSQVSRWDNGTNLPADIYLGGYNCRHDLVPISKERAEERVKAGIYSYGN